MCLIVFEALRDSKIKICLKGLLSFFKAFKGIPILFKQLI